MTERVVDNLTEAEHNKFLTSNNICKVNLTAAKTAPIPADLQTTDSTPYPFRYAKSVPLLVPPYSK